MEIVSWQRFPNSRMQPLGKFVTSILQAHNGGQIFMTEVNFDFVKSIFSQLVQRYTYRVLQTIEMKLILLCIWAERAVYGSAKTALKFKYEI